MVSIHNSRLSVTVCVACGGPSVGLDKSSKDGCTEHQIQEESLYENSDEDDICDAYYREEISIDSKHEWLCDFHALGYLRDPEVLNELVNISEDPKIFLSEKTSNWSNAGHGALNSPRKDGSFANGNSDRNTANSGDDKLLLIHSQCHTLLQAFLSHQRENSTPGKPTTIKEFVDSCLAKLHSSESRVETWEESDELYGTEESLEWEHGYFGAKDYWYQSWRAEGAEWLCADPIDELDIDEIVGYYHYDSDEVEDDTLSVYATSSVYDEPEEISSLASMPPDVLDHISTQLPLKSQMDLAATNKHVGRKLPTSENKYWKSLTMDRFGDCIWELRDSKLFPPEKTDWQKLLRQLTLARQSVLAGHSGSIAEQDQDEITQIGWRSTKPGQGNLPLGLINRMRIWTGLECIGVEGKELKPERFD